MNVLDLEEVARFGKWSVLDTNMRMPDGRPGWLCRCDCGTERVVRYEILRIGRSKSCGCTRPKPQDPAYFWSRIRKGGDVECWPWLRVTNRRGYGIFRLGKRTNRLAHRHAWELTNGPIPAGALICHHCDNPPCCNPSHLYAGTSKDNVRDMHARGRAWMPPPFYGAQRGEEHHQAKLDQAKAELIRRRVAGGERCKDLATEYGVHKATITAVIHNRRWAPKDANGRDL